MNVIRRLRLHMIVSIVAVLMAVLAAILLILNVSFTHIEHVDVNHFVDVIVENGGVMPEMRNNFPLRERKIRPGGKDVETGASVIPPGPLTPAGELRDVRMEKPLRQAFIPHFLGGGDFHNYVSLKISAKNELTEVSRQFGFFHSQAEMYSVVGQIMSEHKSRGFYDYLYYRVTPAEDGSRLVVILNCQAEFAMCHRLYYYSFFIWLVSILVALLVAWRLSGIIVKPVAESFDRQKTFISDAGHELKTPIAVIAANVDVLMPELPDNRWLQYIKSETERMNRLVKDLLFLARDDAGRRVMHIGEFNLSNAVENAVLPFESIIFEQGKRLEYEILPDIFFTGDEQQLKQVIIILVDNAIKNSEKGALIRVKMLRDAQNVIIRVYNTGIGIKEEDLQKIFLRFYRSDASRARKTGGYGLGLAIAKSISDSHGGKLSVASKYGEWAEFSLSLPLNSQKK
ncbi:MAG: HAMP domain-containing histidine kinase [Treponema sp.]|nr:HAMP domain-containing histidine kinase [Treponema sp.]